MKKKLATMAIEAMDRAGEVVAVPTFGIRDALYPGYVMSASGRQTADRTGWGKGVIENPEYRAEQEELNREVRQRMGNITKL